MFGQIYRAKGVEWLILHKRGPLCDDWGEQKVVRFALMMICFYERRGSCGGSISGPVDWFAAKERRVDYLRCLR